jgi:hypothetical protein
MNRQMGSRVVRTTPMTEDVEWLLSEPPDDSPEKESEMTVAQSLSRGYRSHAEAARRTRSFDAFDVNWNDVQLVPQLTDMSCWAAAAAMVVGWRDQMSVDPGEIARGSGHWSAYASGLNPADVPALANAWGLIMEPPQSYTIEGFRQMVELNGPLWVGAAVPRLHAIVVSGIYGDGTPDGTFVRIKDPWGRAPGGAPGAPPPYNPTPGQGSLYELTFRQFVKEYETAAANFAQVNIQILHSGGTAGRMPGTGTAQSYSRAQTGPGAAITVAGWAIDFLANNKGDNTWNLARANGIAYPLGKPELEGSSVYRRKTFRVKGPRKLLFDGNYIDIDLEFKYNGSSIKDVVPLIADMDDVLGEGLSVEGQVIQEDALPTGMPNVQLPTISMAVVRYVLTYHFDYVAGGDIARTEVWMTGAGDHWESRSWPKHYR